jgi:hypothetical protein
MRKSQSLDENTSFVSDEIWCKAETMGIIDEKYSNSNRCVGLLRRIVAAITTVHQRQTDHDFARVIVRSGGRLTDALERDMMRCQSARESGFRTEEPAERAKDNRPLAPLAWF